VVAALLVVVVESSDPVGRSMRRGTVCLSGRWRLSLRRAAALC